MSPSETDTQKINTIIFGITNIVSMFANEISNCNCDFELKRILIIIYQLISYTRSRRFRLCYTPLLTMKNNFLIKPKQ
jgi:hypothetical protein